MERTFPQKVKPIPSCEVEEGVMVSQNRQTPLEANRRVRTSAAMIGLALSVGVYNLPLPNQGDEAIAAEPVVSEPSATSLPSEFSVATSPQKAEATALTQSPLPAGIVEHVVQEGQTLWQLAQFYRVDETTVALNNGISVGAVLHVGQVLQIPTSGQVDATAQVAAGNLPGYYGPVDTAKTVEPNRAVASQASHGAALETMMQKQARLRLSLAQLKSAKQSDASVTASQPVPETAAIPAVVGSSDVPQAGMSYRVALGDTLGAIANANHVSLRELVAVNKLTNPNVLKVDQVLVIPQAPTGAPFTAAADAPVMIASANPDQLTLPKPVAGSARSKTAQLRQATLAQSVAAAEPSTVESRGIAVLPNRSSQMLTADQTVPTVSLTHSSVAPTAIGGSTEVATASFVGQQTAPAEQSTANVQYSYVENLRLEIVKLRAKYQGSESQVQPTTKVAAVPLNVAAPTNSASLSAEAIAEQPTRYTKALQVQIRQLQANRQQSRRAEMQSAAADLAPVAPKAKPQLVATASIGSQSYEPLIPSSVGQMVSPDLPPLGSVDAYLPGNTGKFNGYIWPAKGVLTSGYGYRWGRMHKGIDIAAPVGTPVFAAAAGVVVTAGWNSGGYGNMVEIQHPDGSVTLYAHNSRIIVREGQEVAQGQQIADMGSTGYSTGPHSHFEVHLPGRGAVNPMAFLPRGQA